MTPFGAFLRRTSLDELPQFLNVLQGRMSVVGPAPACRRPQRDLPQAHQELHDPPQGASRGITGWAQVNGLRGETDTVEKMKARIEYDLDYLRHWSLRLDLQIIWKTIFVVFRKPENAY